eukprot:TRINITY_DN14102_c0_g1_i1.p1 TRINITY_DN14102_c0_g1~~TRINITY_DN14102_c0_g1_i1.p1  ORF type:complete len:311 (-),score=66.02 TRINITY_DN14102_c0_g1_i1:337-1194(-)
MCIRDRCCGTSKAAATLEGNPELLLQREPEPNNNNEGPDLGGISQIQLNEIEITTNKDTKARNKEMELSNFDVYDLLGKDYKKSPTISDVTGLPADQVLTTIELKPIKRFKKEELLTRSFFLSFHETTMGAYYRVFSGFQMTRSRNARDELEDALIIEINKMSKFLDGLNEEERGCLRDLSLAHAIDAVKSHEQLTEGKLKAYLKNYLNHYLEILNFKNPGIIQLKAALNLQESRNSDIKKQLLDIFNKGYIKQDTSLQSVKETYELNLDGLLKKLESLGIKVRE